MGKNDLLHRNKAGQELCKQYMIHAMLLCGYNNNSKRKSAKDFWADSDGKSQVVASALKSSSPTLSPKSLFAAMQFVHYVPANFRPIAAKTIYELFGGEGRVLDLCSGYGGRFVGFWFAKNTTHYVGIDPNKHLKQPYHDLSTWLQRRQPKIGKTFRFLDCGSETSTAAQELESENLFDLVFTSPPYFDCEVYDQADVTQSCNAFGASYELWLNGFLHKAMDLGNRSLKRGGFMVINVANGTRCPNLVQDTHNYITSTLNLTFIKTMKLLLPRKPGVQKEPFEPVLIFKK